MVDFQTKIEAFDPLFIFSSITYISYSNIFLQKKIRENLINKSLAIIKIKTLKIFL